MQVHLGRLCCCGTAYVRSLGASQKYSSMTFPRDAGLPHDGH